MMNRGTVLLLLVTGVLSAFSDDTGFLKEGWINKIRPDHPRMILTAEDIPRLREDANGRLKAEFETLKKDVDAVPDKPELILREELVDRLPDRRKFSNRHPHRRRRNNMGTHLQPDGRNRPACQANGAGWNN